MWGCIVLFLLGASLVGIGKAISGRVKAGYFSPVTACFPAMNLSVYKDCKRNVDNDIQPLCGPQLSPKSLGVQ